MNKNTHNIAPKRIILAVLTVAFIGLVAQLSSKASTVSVSVEPELGTNNPYTQIVSDSNASGGKSVLFGTKPNNSVINSNKPCAGTAKPSSWNHIVVLIFENKKYNEVLTSGSSPYLANLAKKCGTYLDWKDADYKANGQYEKGYSSKPNYATLTSGLPPSKHKITDNDYVDTTTADNIFNKLNQIGKSAKTYISTKNTPNCSNSSDQKGAYHDPMRYYTNLGGQSSSKTTYCNMHNFPISSFMNDVNGGTLPAFSIIIPSNDENTHDNSIPTGDAWAQNFLSPLFDSTAYKNGDVAVFFLWDEDTPIPTVFAAPSIMPGSKPILKSGGYPISHYSALRTWQEMLGVSPLIGDSGQAPSLLEYYNGAL